MGKFLKLITNGFMTGVSEPWCNNEGVAVLPFVYKYNQYWFLLTLIVKLKRTLI
ncbi:hypothetical protein [Spiroplasma endosymbiont of Zeiraphera isertana]|uniref:hypothetical protein n=1 Tax=Spiroplasma endosymbiont of Zeiraphera isertana TaxID=3066313 RepID=UPI00313C39D5